MPWPDEPTPSKHKFQFRLPNLPKPEYQALKKLCELLTATQHEVVCVALRVMARNYKLDSKFVVGLLEDFRATAPSETPPLL